MLDKGHLYEVLDKFRKRVITEARKNLTRGGKYGPYNASKDLHSSLDSELAVGPRSFSLQFFMMEYGEYLDKGVDGVKKKHGSPYSYRSKGGKYGLKGMPDPRHFEKWVKQKGIPNRDRKTGRFMSYKTLSFLIARSVFHNGIKPSLFFTKPFEREFAKLDQELVEAFGLDIDEFLESVLNA